MKHATSHHLRAFGVLELLLAFVIIAVAGVYFIPKMLGTTAPLYPGSTQTTSIITGAQSTADSSTALSIADNVYAQAQTSGIVSPLTYSQYATSAAAFSSVTSVLPVTNGAQFTFTDGTQICVTTPLSSGPSPSVFTCA